MVLEEVCKLVIEQYRRVQVGRDLELKDALPLLRDITDGEVGAVVEKGIRWGLDVLCVLGI